MTLQARKLVKNQN